MESSELVLRIIILLILIFAYVYSFVLFKKSNVGIALAVIIVCGAILRVYCSLDPYLHDWDEKFHALVAKNFTNNIFYPQLYKSTVIELDYRNWTSNNIWLHKQPLALWFMSLSLSSFGFNEFVLRIPSALLSVIGIILIFRIGTYYSSKTCGFIAAYLYSINGLIIELCSGRVATDHVDSIFSFFILLSVFLIFKFKSTLIPIYNVFSGISMGLAILTKWLPGLILIPIWVAMLSDNFNSKLSMIKMFVMFLLASILVSLPWQLYIYSYFPLEANWENALNFRHLTEVIEGHKGSIFYFIDKIRVNYGDLIYIPLIYFCWKLYKKIYNPNYLFILIWFIVPLIFFSLAKTKMQGYLLFTAPAYFIITGEFIYDVLNKKIVINNKILRNSLCLLMLVLPFRYSVERVKPFDSGNIEKKQIRNGLLEFRKEIKQNTLLFNYKNTIEAMYYCDLLAYNRLPTTSELSELTNKGYTILINKANESDSIPIDILNFENVKFVNLK